MPPLELGGIPEEAKEMSYENLSHTKWNWEYNLVFVPKGRKKVLYGKIREFLGPVFLGIGSAKEI
jgi:putative transposase